MLCLEWSIILYEYSYKRWEVTQTVSWLQRQYHLHNNGAGSSLGFFKNWAVTWNRSGHCCRLHTLCVCDHVYPGAHDSSEGIDATHSAAVLSWAVCISSVMLQTTETKFVLFVRSHKLTKVQKSSSTIPHHKCAQRYAYYAEMKRQNKPK